jgi:cytochrome d ubiquinol oxidase subunit I
MTDALILARLQFALTAGFHILWPVTTIGLSLFMVLLEGLWLKTRDEAYYRHLRFWSRIFILNFAVGVVSGLPLQFQFGTNWAPFSAATGSFLGSLLGFDATMGFMLEAGFLGIMVFGWNRVRPGMHFFSTCMVALGASLSAFFILVANSWMQTPSGGYFSNGSLVLTSYWEAFFSPDLFWGFTHMWLACLETTLFVIGGLSAWYILKNRHPGFFIKSFKIALIAAIIVTPLQVVVGHGSGNAVALHQPTKLGALEAHWRTNPPGQGAAWKLLAWPNQARQSNDWAIEIPYGLSLITTSSLTGRVKGLSEFPPEDQPPVTMVFYSFRVMIAIGFALVFLMVWTLWVWHRKGLSPAGLGRQKWLLWAWLAAAPLNYAAVETGWITREVGRQPWIVYGLLRTHQGATPLPASAVATSLLVYILVYAAIFTALVIFIVRLIRQGPDLTSPAPSLQKR